MDGRYDTATVVCKSEVVLILKRYLVKTMLSLLETVARFPKLTTSMLFPYIMTYA